MTDGSNSVTVRDIDIPFWRIVIILIKWSIAAIPAAIIAAIIYGLLVALFGGIAMGVLEWIGGTLADLPPPPAP